MLRKIGAIFKFWKSIPFIIDFYKSREVATWKKIVIPIAFLVYFFDPFDLIPDYIPFLGEVDDLGVLILLFNYTVYSAPISLKEKHGYK